MVFISRASQETEDVPIPSLPEILQQLQDMLEDTEAELRDMPKPPSLDAFGEVLDLLNSFYGELSKHTQGIPGQDQMLQLIKPYQKRFRRLIWATKPDFRPYKADEVVKKTSVPAPKFLAAEEESDDVIRDIEERPIYLDAVWTYANGSV